MKYINEIKQIVSEYDKLNSATIELERMAKLLEERHAELKQALDANRLREKALIDKIVQETGEHPDYHKIMHLVNDHT